MLFVPIMLAQTLQTRAADVSNILDDANIMQYITPILKNPATWLLGAPTVIAVATSTYLEQREAGYSQEAQDLAMKECSLTQIPDDRNRHFWQIVDKHKKNLKNSILDTTLRRIKLGATLTVVGTVIGSPLYAALKADSIVLNASGVLIISAILFFSVLNIGMGVSSHGEMAD